jgi:Kelch motif
VLAGCNGGDDAAPADRPTGGRGATPAPGVFPATPLPEARTEVAGALWGNRIAIAGGFRADGTPSDRLDLLDRSGRWARGPDLPSAYDHASLTVLDGRLWLVGGNATDDGDSGPSAATYSLGPGDDAWREEAPLRAPRSALATVPAAGGMIAIGGVGGGEIRRSTEVYDAARGEWRTGPELSVAREHTSAAVAGGAVYAIGGRQASLESNLDSVEVLPVAPGSWQDGPSLEHARGGIAAASLGEVPCVAGGEEPGGTIASVECLVSGEWSEVARLDLPRHGLAMVAVGRRLHVLGGGPQPGLFVSDAHEILEPAIPRGAGVGGQDSAP